MPEVLQRRGPAVESVHPFSVAFVRDREEPVVLGADRVTTFRSASKPFQLATSLEVLGDPDLPDDELAVGAASHSAEPAHLAVVERILARFGLDASGLRCGAHPPVHEPSARAILRAGGEFTDLHNNCSGKHSFMLAAATRAGWAADYRPPSHPYQVLVRARLDAWADAASEIATDGCGVPTFIYPLSAVARAWSRVAIAMRAVDRGEGLAPPDARIGRVGWAMARRPDLTSGTGRLDLDVVRAAREPMAVKIGAMGLFCIALPARGAAIAVKVASGSGEALPAAVAWSLARFAPGAFAEPEPWALREVRNVVGLVVGSWDAGG
jgi:L-asparaginase II